MNAKETILYYAALALDEIARTASTPSPLSQVNTDCSEALSKAFADNRWVCIPSDHLKEIR